MNGGVLGDNDTWTRSIHSFSRLLATRWRRADDKRATAVDASSKPTADSPQIPWPITPAEDYSLSNLSFGKALSGIDEIGTR